MFKSIFLVATILFSACSLCSCEKIKNTYGTEISPRTIRIGDYKYTIIKGAKPYDRKLEWEKLSDELWPTKNPKKRYIPTFGNKKSLPKYLSGKLTLDEQHLHVVLQDLRTTKSFCCASDCIYRYNEPIYMEALPVYFSAVIQGQHVETGEVQKAEVEFPGLFFACKCNTEKEADHHKEHYCPFPHTTKESIGRFCDSLEGAEKYQTCRERFPQWTKEFLSDS